MNAPSITNMNANHDIGGLILSADEVNVFRDSLQRIQSQERFLDLFYTYFIQSSAGISAFFADVDMHRLKSKLVSTLNLLSTINTVPAEVSEHLVTVGQYHHKLAVPRDMYTAWTNALICAVGTCDEDYTVEVQAAWRKAADVAITRLQEGYP